MVIHLWLKAVAIWAIQSEWEEPILYVAAALSTFYYLEVSHYHSDVQKSEQEWSNLDVSIKQELRRISFKANDKDNSENC